MRQTIFFLALLLVITACNPTEVPPTNTPEPTATAPVVESVQESPIQTPAVVESVAESPLPTPTTAPAPVPEATAVPAPNDGTGSVAGTLMSQSGDLVAPLSNGRVYLARIVQDSNGGDLRMVSFDEQRDALVVTDEGGKFIFENIQPGEYGLVYSIPGISSQLLKYADTGNDLLITVEADEVLILDDLVVTLTF